MAVFVSYGKRERVPTNSMIAALERAGYQVVSDVEGAGGEAWWRGVLNGVLTCDVFVFTLSDDALESKPCQAQLAYAQALGKPIVPVQIASVDHTRSNPLSAIQVVDFRNPGVADLIMLAAAIEAAQARAGPLPDPLPGIPPMPYAYLTRLAQHVSGSTLSPRDQNGIVAELRAALVDDGGDEAVRRDVAQMLCMLLDRPDVTYATRMEVESLLGSLDDPARTIRSDPLYPNPWAAPIYPSAPGPPPSAPPPPGPALPWWRRRK